MKPSRSQKLDFNYFPEESADGVMNCAEVYKLRYEMLSGRLPNFCKGCMMLKEYEDVHEFVQELYREGCILQITDEIAPMCQIGQVNELFVEMTTRCNLKCIYCLHSTAAFKDWIREAGIEKFFDILDVLVKKWRVKEISTTGIGEFTLVEQWPDILERIRRTYPEVKISLFSNFAKPLSDREIDALISADRINVSCDTVNEELVRRFAELLPYAGAAGKTRCRGIRRDECAL